MDDPVRTEEREKMVEFNEGHDPFMVRKNENLMQGQRSEAVLQLLIQKARESI